MFDIEKHGASASCSRPQARPAHLFWRIRLSNGCAEHLGDDIETVHNARSVHGRDLVKKDYGSFPRRKNSGSKETAVLSGFFSL